MRIENNIYLKNNSYVVRIVKNKKYITKFFSIHKHGNNALCLARKFRDTHKKINIKTDIVTVTKNNKKYRYKYLVFYYNNKSYRVRCKNKKVAMNKIKKLIRKVRS